MKIICFTGMDGAGKTTLARDLVQLLRQRGIPASYVYGRTVPVISRFLMALGRATFLRGSDHWKQYESYAFKKRKTMRNPILARIYSSAILIDFYLQIWAKLVPHVLAGEAVILDRYVYDTVISDLAVHLSYSDQRLQRTLKAGMRLLPRPQQVFLIDLPEEVAFSRKDDIPHISYLRERRRRYLQLKDLEGVYLLDGQDAPDRLLVEVERQLSQHNVIREFAESLGE